MEPFASNLRKRAEQLGISSAEAARRVGLSERRYGNYVSGRREPDLATLIRIAEVLGTSANDLLAEVSDPEDSERATSRERIIAAVNTLPAADQESLTIMIEALAQHHSRDGRRR